jgi:hypothetical protein
MISLVFSQNKLTKFCYFEHNLNIELGGLLHGKHPQYPWLESLCQNCVKGSGLNSVGRRAVNLWSMQADLAHMTCASLWSRFGPKDGSTKRVFGMFWTFASVEVVIVELRPFLVSFALSSLPSLQRL